MKEELRKSINKFLKLYYDSCKEIYQEIGLDKITGKQFKYLNLIYKTDNITSSLFAEISKLSKPTVTEIINRFIDSDLAYREQSPSDKRVSYLKLTGKGRVLATSNEMESSRFTDNVMNRLEDDELDILRKIFDKMKDEVVEK